MDSFTQITKKSFPIVPTHTQITEICKLCNLINCYVRACTHPHLVTLGDQSMPKLFQLLTFVSSNIHNLFFCQSIFNLKVPNRHQNNTGKTAPLGDHSHTLYIPLTGNLTPELQLYRKLFHIYFTMFDTLVQRAPGISGEG